MALIVMSRGNIVNWKFQHRQSADVCSNGPVTSADHSCNVNAISDSNRRLCTSSLRITKQFILTELSLNWD